MFNNKNIIPLEERIVLDASIIYVDADAQSGGNGDTWALAYDNLDSALAEAALNPDSQIWIAEGTYKPSGGLESSTFLLPDDVSLYGGFRGNEKSLEARTPNKNITILSGDILGDDHLGNKSDNVWHVVKAVGVTALMDGLTITGGFADGPADTLDDSGGGLFAQGGANLALNAMTFLDNHASEGPNVQSNFLAGGGGIFGIDAGTTITVKNSVFTGNVANGIADIEHAGFGGAINMGGDAILYLYDSTFNENTAWRAGGAVRIRNAPDGLISNSVFEGNSVSREGAFATSGAGISIQSSLVDITHSTFLNNHADSVNFAGAGGAIFVDSIFGRLSLVTVNDSYFEGNTSTVFGGGAIFALGTSGNPDSLLTINNSLFMNNESSNGGAVYANSFDTVINNSLFLGNHSRLFGGAVTYSNFFDTLFGIPTTKSLTINDSVFVNNTVEPAPGEMAFHELIFNIFGFSLDPESIGGGGAVLNHENGNLIINHSRFDNNMAIDSLGGAIMNGGVNGASFTDPLTVLNNDHLTLDGSLLVGNSAVSGGALAAISMPAMGSSDNSVLITDNVFKQNKASDNGGALYFTRTDADVLDNIFHGNNDAAHLGDKIYGLDSIVNDIPSSDSSAISILIQTNTFKNLDSDDIFMA